MDIIDRQELIGGSTAQFLDLQLEHASMHGVKPDRLAEVWNEAYLFELLVSSH